MMKLSSGSVLRECLVSSTNRFYCEVPGDPINGQSLYLTKLVNSISYIRENGMNCALVWTHLRSKSYTEPMVWTRSEKCMLYQGALSPHLEWSPRALHGSQQYGAKPGRISSNWQIYTNLVNLIRFPLIHPSYFPQCRMVNFCLKFPISF